MIKDLIDGLPWWLRRSGWIHHALTEHKDWHILSGPFRGMRFVGGQISGGHYPMLLGTHEMELHPLWEQIIQWQPSRIFNIGAAEGYYAVGIAMRMPGALIQAFETMKQGQSAIRKMAQLNRVNDRVMIHGQCNPNSLNSLLDGSHSTVIICDVEGYEDILLDPVQVPGLAKCHIVCEVHDMFVAGVGRRLRQRFAATHDMESIPARERTLDNWPLALPHFPAMFSRKMVRLMDEKREGPMEWLWMKKSIRMKICFGLSSAGIGGFRTFTLNLGRQLERHGHQVFALLAAKGVEGNHSIPRQPLGGAMNVDLCQRRRVFSRSRFLGQVIKTIHAQQPDILIINHSLWIQAALPYLDRNIKRVVIVHSLTPAELALPQGNSAWWDMVVAVSPCVNDRMLQEWPLERVCLIPVGVPEPSVPVRTTFSDYPLKICYAGRLDQSQKNILLLPEIAAALQELNVPCQWTIIGEGPDRAKLETRLASMNLSRHFRFLASQDSLQVQKLIVQHHLLVLPSFSESIGHVLMEAQMLGVVPIATQLPGATDFVITNEKDGCLCPSGDAQTFARTLASLHHDRALLQRLSENGRNSVRERFDIRIITRAYECLFKNLNERSIGLRALPKYSFMGFRSIPEALMPPRWRTAMRVARQNILGGV